MVTKKQMATLIVEATKDGIEVGMQKFGNAKVVAEHDLIATIISKIHFNIAKALGIEDEISEAICEAVAMEEPKEEADAIKTKRLS